jgi:hypothetical protein
MIRSEENMTRVQVHFRLPKKLEDATLARLSEASAVYGIQRLRVGAELDSLMVEYDATRLKPADLEAALAAAGIAAEPVYELKVGHALACPTSSTQGAATSGAGAFACQPSVTLRTRDNPVGQASWPVFSALPRATAESWRDMRLNGKTPSKAPPATIKRLSRR